VDTDERQLTSADFPVQWPVTTRWADNDMFGHLNNAVYYQLFDSAINGWIRTQAGVDPVSAPWLGVVAESGCRYFAELAFPDPLVVGLAVARIGTSSVTYRLGLLPVGGRVAAVGHPTRVAAVGHPTRVAAVGHWVHVYVDRVTRRPVPIPDAIRALLETATV
jgi:acyl-CoA thioester hydrolase